MGDLELAVRERVVLLTTLVPSLTVENVWRLPLWAWRQYAAMADAEIAERMKHHS